MQNYVGQQIDRYRITERLGMGGMAVVYKAYDTRLERDVAIKLIRVDEIPASQHERLMKRFEREAKAMAKFSHPNIVPVYDYGEVDESPYLVMEYIQGGTLKSRIDRPVDYVKALRWLVPIADALRYAQERGVIHRDVKPSNILFDEEDRPVLTDFGIAKILETDEATLTGTGMGVGTPEYMAPEQWQGKASEATDQYALGVVLYELITGKKPYHADTPAAVAILQATEPLPQPSALVNGIPEEVEKVLYKALARDPRDRYQSMAIFHKALVELEQGTVFETGGEPEKSEKEISKIRHEEINSDEYSDNSLSASEIEKIGGSKKQESTSDDKLVGEGRTVDEIELGDQTSDRLSTSANKGQAKSQQIGDKKSQSALNKKKVGLGASSAVIIVFILSVICAAVFIVRMVGISNKSASSSSSSNSINRTATLEVKQTATANSALTATARVAKTATAQAKPTATAKAAHDLLNNFIKDSYIIFEEETYSLDHYDDDFVEVYSTGIEEKNFILEVTFVNPYDLSVGAWDYGIMFRHTGSNDQFRLFLSSSETWYLYNRVESEVKSFSGDLYINTSASQENKIQFVAISDIGYLFVNNNFITELDLSARDFSGEIKIGTGFINNHEVEGYATEFKNLVIYKIGGEGTVFTPTPTSHSTLSESNHSAISVNSRALSTNWYGAYDFQVVFENEDGWGKGNYLLNIETVEGPSECEFYGPTEDECKIVNYNSEEYLVCTRAISVNYNNYTWETPPYYCSYEIQLLENGERIYSFDFSYTFDRE